MHSLLTAATEGNPNVPILPMESQRHQAAEGESWSGYYLSPVATEVTIKALAGQACTAHSTLHQRPHTTAQLFTTDFKASYHKALCVKIRTRFSFLNFILFERQKESSIHEFTPEMPTRARVEPGSPGCTSAITIPITASTP